MLEHWIKYPTQRRNLDKLKKLQENAGTDIPALSRIPELHKTNRWYWEAFEFLSEKRIINEKGPQPIQVSEIKAYADMRRTKDLDDLDDLLDFLTALDRIWLKDAYHKKELAEKKARAEAAKRRGRR